MICRLIILLLIVGCEEALEPEDCAGVAGGDAVEDMCSICDSDAANDCVQDCAGVWGGNSYLDECGGCDANVNNDCVQDCADAWGGTAVLSGCDNLCNSTATEDNCGVCDGNNSPDTGTCDCEGTPNGTAWVSDCGCVSIDNDGNDCDDCSNVPDGAATTDNCGVCDANANNDCIQDECGNWGGDGSTCEELWNVYYDWSVPISGFQFQVNGGTIVGVSGGAASDAGLSVSTSSSTVLAFSLSGSTIPSGTGTLISLELVGDSNSFCISNLVLSNIDGSSIPAIIENCNTIKYSDN